MVMDKTTRTEPYWVASAPHGFAGDLYHTSKQESPSAAMSTDRFSARMQAHSMTAILLCKHKCL